MRGCPNGQLTRGKVANAYRGLPLRTLRAYRDRLLARRPEGGPARGGSGLVGALMMALFLVTFARITIRD